MGYKMRIVIAHQTVAVHDAVGNDIEQMYLLLKPKYECYVYAQNGVSRKVKIICLLFCRTVIPNCSKVIKKDGNSLENITIEYVICIVLN